jgi:hypothetical protein
VKWLGCTISPSFVGEPECNGVAERFTRTLKEHCIYLHQFASLEEARRVISEFIARYNVEWLIERLGMVARPVCFVSRQARTCRSKKISAHPRAA